MLDLTLSNNRRKKCGMSFHDLLPTALKGSEEGKENIPAHTPPASAPVTAAPVSSAASTAPEAIASSDNSSSSSYQPRPASGGSNAFPAPPQPNPGGWAAGRVGAASADGGGEDSRPGVPKVKRAMPSVLSRWPPSQQGQDV
jgi:hypothetical protein